VKNKLKVLDLFSGLGGFSLGLERTGHFETVAFCDNNKYSKLVIDKHWKGIKIYDDIKEITKEKFTTDGIEAPDIITGGVPCQPFSVAGKQKGTSDDRYLWPEMFRIIKAFKSKFVIVENVRGIVNIENGMVFETVCSDLESEGYEVQAFNIPAAGVGAPHRRERIWFIAVREDVANTVSNDERREISRSYEEERRIQEEHRQNNSTTGKSSRTSEIRNGDNGYETTESNVADTEGLRFRGRSGEERGIKKNEFQQTEQKGSSFRSETERRSSQSGGDDVADTESIGSDVRGREQHQGERSGQGEIGGASSQDDANSYGKRLEGFRGEHKLRNSEEEEQTSRDGWWSVEPNVGRVAHGVSGRVHRLKGLGNSIVPQIVEEIGKALIKAERSK